MVKKHLIVRNPAGTKHGSLKNTRSKALMISATEFSRTKLRYNCNKAPW